MRDRLHKFNSLVRLNGLHVGGLRFVKVLLLYGCIQNTASKAMLNEG